MDVIKQEAIDFAYQIHAYAHSLEGSDQAISSKLLYINKSSEKVRFLSYLQDEIESSYQSHAKVCTHPETCSQNDSYETLLYAIKQQREVYVDQGQISQLEKPAMKFFLEGKYFDAYTAILNEIKRASKSIVLIDGYVDDSTLAFFPTKESSITIQIITKKKSLTVSFDRAVELYNKQYGALEVSVSENFHDRFLIIDEALYYHIGASIKDAGNKVFMYSRIDDTDIQELIRQKIKSM